jgi:hypothetical protein
VTRSRRIALVSLLAVACAALAVWVVLLVGPWFFALPAQNMAAVAGISGVLLVPIITYFTSRSLERRRSLEDGIREHKTRLYDDLMKGLVRMLNLQKAATTMTQPEMLQFFATITPGLITYGSNDVLRAWNTFRRISTVPNVEPKAVLVSFEGLLTAMRKDLGHAVAFMRPGELLGAFVNDIDKIFPELRK